MAAKSETLDVQRNGRSFTVRYPHAPALRHVLHRVFHGKEYPPGVPHGYRTDVIVDAGTNVGAAAVWFHALYPDTRIVAFEPSPIVFAYLRTNTAEIPQIEIRNHGLLDREMSASLQVGQYHFAQSPLVQHDKIAEQTEQIELRRASTEFHSLDIDRISMLKIDTEGYGVSILRDLAGSWL